MAPTFADVLPIKRLSSHTYSVVLEEAWAIGAGEHSQEGGERPVEKFVTEYETDTFQQKQYLMADMSRQHFSWWRGRT